MARWNQTEFQSATAKEDARRKIVGAAKRHGIEVSEDSNVAKPSRKSLTRTRDHVALIRRRAPRRHRRRRRDLGDGPGHDRDVRRSRRRRSRSRRRPRGPNGKSSVTNLVDKVEAGTGSPFRRSVDPSSSRSSTTRLARVPGALYGVVRRWSRSRALGSGLAFGLGAVRPQRRVRSTRSSGWPSSPQAYPLETPHARARRPRGAWRGHGDGDPAPRRLAAGAEPPARLGAAPSLVEPHGNPRRPHEPTGRALQTPPARPVPATARAFPARSTGGPAGATRRVPSFLTTLWLALPSAFRREPEVDRRSPDTEVPERQPRGSSAGVAGWITASIRSEANGYSPSISWSVWTTARRRPRLGRAGVRVGRRAARSGTRRCPVMRLRQAALR